MEVLPAAVRLINQELIPRSSPNRQRVLTRVTRILEKAQRDFERRRSRGKKPDLYLGLSPPSSAEDLREWGQRLRLRREEAGLTRLQLAGISGVADSTIRNLETGRHKPTRPIIMRLQAVQALSMPLPAGNQPFGRSKDGTPLPDPTAFPCNCWFAPEYDSIKMAREMVQRLNSSGGHVEQTYLYLDPAAAAAWCAITEQDAWARAKALVPLRELARAIKDLSGTLPLDIIGLGTGEARDEVRLVQSLFDQQIKGLRLFLLEISQPLLSAGYQHAAQVLGDLPAIGIYAVQGNFHNLPSYTPLLEDRSRRRLACMFGCTFSNLENEISFLRNSLCGFGEGDLLLIDVPVAFASPAQPEEIMKRDPRLAPSSHNVARPREEEFYKGPFKRHVSGLRSVRLETVLDLAGCPIPGSYAVAWHAHVRTDRGPDRQFSVAILKRYDPQLLNTCMSQNGWEPLRSFTYAEEYHPRFLSLYRKRSSLTLGIPRGDSGSSGGETKAT